MGERRVFIMMGGMARADDAGCSFMLAWEEAPVLRGLSISRAKIGIGFWDPEWDPTASKPAEFSGDVTLKLTFLKYYYIVYVRQIEGEGILYILSLHTPFSIKGKYSYTCFSVEIQCLFPLK
jgi:hypothetical protein